MLLRTGLAVSIVAIGGCSYKVAKEQYAQGFSADPLEGGGFLVRYNGQSMEPEWSLEKLLRRGVADLCGGDRFQLAEVTFEIEEVMHRWEPRYRTVSAVASCGPQP